MAMFHDTMEDDLRAALVEAPLTPQELTTHAIASRVAGIMSELDDLIALSRKPAHEDAQHSLAQEWRALDTIATKAQFLASFGEVRQRPVGLRMIRGKRS